MSGSALEPLPAEVLVRLASVREVVAAKVVVRLGLSASAGEKVKAGVLFTLRMLEAVAAVGDGILLEDQMRWALDRLPHDGIPPRMLARNLEVLREVLREEMADAWSGALESYCVRMVGMAREAADAEG